ncbi:MAG: serine/threonine-protein kinase [Planctomycetaceae bacterium]|nr:serine/threonine protein kinase [Planctomycetaceae bacterium]
MAPSQTVDVPGYQVLNCLGRGAGSSIWQIRDCRSDALYALKRVLRRPDVPGDRVLMLAINEAHVGMQMDHRVIRHIYQVRRIRQWMRLQEVQLIMELCQGQSLQERLPRSLPETVAVFSSVASGLAHMHARGYVHADIKPNNILMAADGTVKVIDLGQSCPIGTVKDRIQGTPDFIAPEQVHRRPLDSRTDIFNFGASLYWTLAGRPISTAMPPRGSVTLRSEAVTVPISQYSPGVPAALDKLVAECIELYPDNRPSSILEVASRLSLIAASLAPRTASEPSPDDTVFD